jgi:DNA replication protein DnaC
MPSEPRCTYCRRLVEVGVVCHYCQVLHEEFWVQTCPGFYRKTDMAKLAAMAHIPAAVHAEVLGWPYGPKGLFLHGSPGTGKTRTMWTLLRRWHDEGHRIASFHMANPESTFSLQVAQHYRDGDAIEWLERIQAADVLFWDDIDKDKLTDRAEETAFAMFEHFTSYGKPVMVTTNVRGQAFSARFTGERGSAILRRIREFCVGRTFDAGGNAK